MSLNPIYAFNPYTPSFGMPPTSYIHRHDEESKILNEFCSPAGPPLSYIIIGARGVGKTVLMHEMANRFESYPDWVVARMNPNTDMLDSLMKKLAGHQKVSSIIKASRINLSFFGLGIDFPTSRIKDTEDAITEIIKGMQKDDKRLLIIVDEAVNTPYMKAFASAYQNLMGQRLPAYLLMTGLFENINTLRNEKNLTFLYRMPRITLGSLQLSEIAENYKDTFLIDDQSAIRMAKYTRGYSYAFQLLGKLAWDHDGNYNEILNEYRSTLYEMVYEKIWDEMSQTDRELLFMITKTKDGKVKEIRDLLDWKANQFSPYRDRLLKKGVIQQSKYGHLDFTLPYFKGFILDHCEILQAVEGLPDDL